MSVSSVADVTAAVRKMYERNRQQGHAPWCDKDYDFVCPSSGTYPFQWLWDSCFHAIALTHIDVGRAMAEMRSLVANQSDDGLISHVTFWQREKYEEMLKTYGIAYRTPYLSDCMQPPLVAEAVSMIAARGGGAAFVREMVPPLKRFYDWLDRTRDPDRDGLIATLQADESGLDHASKYDAYLGVAAGTHAECDAGWRRNFDAYNAVGRVPEKMFALDKFICEDVLVNTIYVENLRVLAQLCRDVGDAAAATMYDERATRGARSLLEKCWDEEHGMFYDLAGHREEKLRTRSVSSLFPLLLPELPAKMVDRLVAAIEDPTDFGARYPVPSVSMREPSYVAGACDGTLVWRGPSWINTNWYVARGLRRHGADRLAQKIEDASVELTMSPEGFREYYNPQTGEGFGARDFSWSGLVVDMVAVR